MEKKSLKLLFLFIGLEMLGVILLVWLFDPFYQYHGPLGGMETVLYDRDNQMPGSIRNLEYDSVLVGSSVAENFDSEFLDSAYGCRTLKVIRASGSLADLLYYLDMVREKRDLTNVFWCLDLFALSSSTESTLYGEEIPRYLHTATVLDDFPYVFNKEILLEKVPQMFGYALQGINTGGHAYDWSRDKNFSADNAMRAYEKPKEILPPQDFSEIKGLVEQNLALLCEEIREHEGTMYRILFPPYSMMWWDCAYVNGMLEQNFYMLERTLPALLQLPNVEIYYFQNEADTVCNPDLYMDMIHYSPEVNQEMLEAMIRNDNRVTLENWESVIADMRALAKKITEEEIYRYY